MGGFLANFLTGIGESLGQQRERNERQAQQDIEQQQNIYKVLLSNPDPEIQAIGLAGLAEPAKKNIFGNLKKSPTFEKARQIIAHGGRLEAEAGGGTPGPSPGPSPPPPPPSQPQAAAMPDVPAATGGGGVPGQGMLNLFPGLQAPTMSDQTGLTGQGMAPTPLPTPPPGAPGSVFAPSDTLGPEATAALLGGGPPPAPPPEVAAASIPTGPPPEATVASAFQGVKSADAAIARLNDLDPFGLSPQLRPLRAQLQTAKALGIPWEKAVEGVTGQVFPTATRIEAAEEMQAKRLTEAEKLARIRADASAAAMTTRLAADREKYLYQAHAQDARLEKTLATRLETAHMTNDRQEIGRINKLRTEQVKANAEFSSAGTAIDDIRNRLDTYANLDLSTPIDKLKAYNSYSGAVDGFLGLVGRAAGEAGGRFSDQDAQRFRSLLKPGGILTPFTAFDPKMAAERLQQAYQLLDEVRDRRTKAYQDEIERGPGAQPPVQPPRGGKRAAPPPEKPVGKTYRATATNPKTGEKVGLTEEGKWEPIR